MLASSRTLPSNLFRLRGRTISRPLAYFCSSSKKESTSNCGDCFQLLGIERSFLISPKKLKASYKSLMNRLHPDRYAHVKDLEERNTLHNEASSVTQCYDTLSNPQMRAVHLLDLSGNSIDETAKSELVGPEFLMQIMEVRETIDFISSDQDLQKMLDENRDRAGEVCDDLGEAFEKGNLDEARRLTAMLQYWNRAEETIREKMTEIE